MTRVMAAMLAITTPLFGPPVAGAAEHPPVSGAAGTACVACHQELMSRRVMHGPAAAGECAACHVVDETPGRRRVGLKNGASHEDTTRLCGSCHEDSIARLKQAHRHAPVAAGTCTACHDPHGSNFKFQLAADGNRACVRCHEDIGQSLAQSHAHGPAVASCAICHDAHAGPQPAQLRAAGNIVCLACHLDTPADQPIADQRALFGRSAVESLDRLIADAPRIALDAAQRSGHPTIRHPVDGKRDPAEPARSLRCASCHNPHGAAGAKLLRFGATGTSPLCIRCHVN